MENDLFTIFCSLISLIAGVRFGYKSGFESGKDDLRLKHIRKYGHLPDFE